MEASKTPKKNIVATTIKARRISKDFHKLIEKRNKILKKQARNFINTSCLEVGQTYRNYKEICDAIKALPTSSDSKVSQLKNWERYFSWEKKGHKFIIKEIYDKPKPLPTDKRTLRTSEVCGLGQLLVMEYIANSKQYPDPKNVNLNWCFISKKELYSKIGLTNQHWQNKYRKNAIDALNSHCEAQVKELCEQYRVINKGYDYFSKTEVEAVSTYIYKKLYDIFYKTTNSMEKHGLMSVEFTEEPYYEISQVINGDWVHRVTTQNENKAIKNISDQVLQSMYKEGKIESPDKNEIFGNLLFLTYYNKVKSICENTYGFTIETTLNKMLVPTQYDNSTILPDLTRFMAYSLADNIELMNKMFYNRLITGLPKAKMNKDYRENKDMMDFTVAKQKILIDYFVSLKDDKRILSWWQGKRNIFTNASFDIFSSNYEYQYDKIQN